MNPKNNQTCESIFYLCDVHQNKRSLWVNGVDFIPERDMELYEAYRRALKMREVKSHREAVMRAISSHASRFWISTLQAYRGILLIRKGKTKEKGRSIRNKMIDDI